MATSKGNKPSKNGMSGALRSSTLAEKKLTRRIEKGLFQQRHGDAQQKGHGQPVQKSKVQVAEDEQR